MSPAWRENSTGNLGDDRFRHLRPGSLYFTESTYAVNAAIRRAGLEGRRKTNPVVDGQLVPKPPGAHNKKRRRDEPAAAPSQRARRR